MIICISHHWVRSNGYYLHSKYASYYGLHLDIDNGWRLKGKHYAKRVDFTFQMSISISPVAIFQHHQRIKFTFHESRACPQYSDFLDTAKHLMQKLLKQGYVGHRLKPSLQIFHGFHHELVYRYEISFFSKGNGTFHFYVLLKVALNTNKSKSINLFSITNKAYTGLD